MTLRQTDNPYGYRELLVFKKAEQLQTACVSITSHFPNYHDPKGERGLTGEKGVEGNLKTLVALADQMDRSARSVKQNIVEGWKRNSTREYYDFLGFSMGANAELEEDCNDILKGIYKGIERERGDREIEQVEKLPFYPLDTHLPPVVQLKLRCKELNLLFHKLQQSLLGKMSDEHRLSMADNLNRTAQSERTNDEWLRREQEKLQREEREKGE
ncbi:MAG: four helix bundle protein [Candidatus Paceibacterota bacterium]